MRARLSYLCLASVLLLDCTASVLALPNNIRLNSDSIATNALRVAEATHTSGRCYAAVSQALKPLSVDLHGAAAYQASPLLQQDKRFMPITITSVDELRRGDIIVFNKSNSHPYGHISVYEGNYTEASDHVSSVTHTQAYGGAVVFRLRDELMFPQTEASQASGYAPNYDHTDPPRYADSQSQHGNGNQDLTGGGMPPPATRRRNMHADQSGNGYYKVATTGLKRLILNRCAKLIWQIR